jgi:hypothetical protein
MSKPGADPASGISLGDVLRRPKRHPACRRRETQSGSCTEVRPVKAGMFSRRQTCRGNSQEPRSLDSRVAGNQDPEAYRQGLPWGDHESPGRNDSERACGACQLAGKWTNLRLAVRPLN